MKKNVIRLMIFTMLIGSPCTFAANLTDNFSRSHDYRDGQFKDVGDEWFAQSVQESYELGLMNGVTDNLFDPQRNLSNIEAVVMAARLHHIHSSGNDAFPSDGALWYQPYLDYAIENDICDNNFVPEESASRSFFVGILGNAAKNISLEQKNEIADGALYGVSGWYSSSVYSFYRAGILNGNDKYGTFSPDSAITRAEAAAILVRIVDNDARINVQLEERPVEGSYSIMADDGSLEAYKQRALVANFQWLLDGKEKSSSWTTDTYTVNYAGSKGNPSETIIIPHKYLDQSYDGDYYVAFLASHVDKNLTGEIRIPTDRVKYNLSWLINGKYYDLSVVNTGGQVEFSQGFYITGDLQLYYAGTNDVAPSSTTYTYNSYTSAAQDMIETAKQTYSQQLDSKVIDALVHESYPQTGGKLNTIIGQLTDWNVSWYITSNKNDMYRPIPRQNGSQEQTEYVFTCRSNESLSSWCKKHFGEYVIAVTAEYYDVSTPIMLAAITGYSPTADGAVISSWEYKNGRLDLIYKPAKTEYTDTLKLYDDSKLLDKINLIGLVDVSEVNTWPHPHYDHDPYYIKYKDLADRHFYMIVNNDEITLYRKGTVITMHSCSDTAVIGGKTPEYNWMGDLTGFKKSGSGQTVTVSPSPKIFSGVVFLPPEFLADNLLKPQEEKPLVTEDPYTPTPSDKPTGPAETEEPDENSVPDGLAKLVIGSSDWGSYLESYPKKHFKLDTDTHDGYKYTLTLSYEGPYLHFNVGSTKALYIKKYGYNDHYHDDGTVIELQAPQKIGNDLFLPADTVISVLFN